MRRNGASLCPRDDHGNMLPMDPAVRMAQALDRFREKCRFDSTTGCVLWTGATSSGRGNSAMYGTFWYEGRRWFAHRWAALHIHQLDAEGLQVGHCCPHGPNTLCVQHVEPQTQHDNLAELHGRRRAAVEQTSREKQFWLFVSLGIEPAPMFVAPDNDQVPFYSPPKWLVDDAVNSGLDCPF